MIPPGPGTPHEQARALIDGAGSRTALKKGGTWLDGPGRHLRAAVLAEGRRRGVDLPDEAVDWPGKRLLRRCLAREGAARARTTPIRRDEGFTCVHCGLEVPPHGRTARDHCPRCLRSLHVDVVPGDRAADCGGVLDPIAVELRHGDAVLTFRCRACGQTRVNRAVLDGELPDDWAAVIALSPAPP